MPRHLEFDADSPAAAQRFLADLDGCAVVKPAGGTGAGQGIATGIRDRRTLRRAVQQAAAFSRRLLIEEEIAGSSYRLLYLGGELVDAIRRDPPTLEGDGQRSLRELIAAENAHRLAGDPVTALHPIRPGLECTTTLRHQGRDLTSVPAPGERVVVKAACNENAARENLRVMDALHPSIVALGQKVTALLDLELGGLDLIAPKIDVPLAESGGVVNEINTTPGLHHHALVADPRTRADVGPRILEHIFARSEAPHLAAAWEAS